MRPAFSATCLQVCVDDRDCTPPYRCVSIINTPDTGGPGVAACVSSTDPAPCGGSLGEVCTDVEGGSFCDGATLLTNGFGSSPNNLCGYERVYCPNGCETVPDAGSPFFNRDGARCR